MELTPELFESIEFTEVKRGGYDTDEVETFLEQAGTELARILARLAAADRKAETLEAEVRQLRAKAAQAQAQAQAPSPAPAPAAAPPAVREDHVDVEQAARVLAMAQRTATSTVDEAKTEAQELLAEARNKSERLVLEARSQSDSLMARAREAAEREYGERKRTLEGEIRLLENRRNDLGEDVAVVEDRIAALRLQLAEVVASIDGLIGGTTRPSVEAAKAQAVNAAPAPQAALPQRPSRPADVQTAPPAQAAQAAPIPQPAPQPQASQPQAAHPEPVQAQPVQQVDLTDESTGAMPAANRDRYLDALDAAVNGEEDVENDDEQLAAFFEGDPADRANRRFGRRR